MEQANQLNCSNQEEDKSIEKKAHKILGIPLNELNREPDCWEDLGELRSSSTHTVLVDVNLEAPDFPKPSPDVYTDKWHEDYVRLPCSPESFYYSEDEDLKKTQKSRWELIEKCLSSEIRCSSQLVQAILAYNSGFKTQWDFSALVTYIDKEMNSTERKEFFDSTLPAMVNLALDLPNLCTQGIPLLRTGIDHSVTLSQKQIASLLANAFFCTFPRRYSNSKKSEYGSYPHINFTTLFSAKDKDKLEKLKFEKFKCFFNYFKRISTKETFGVITFHRKCMKIISLLLSSDAILSEVHFSSEGLIEQQNGLLQVDFANKYIGGGIFKRGCVQEEIFCLLCPELIVSRLFTESLDNNEALAVVGCERFNNADGYARTFKWVSDHVDKLPRDKWSRCSRKIVAIDATRFSSRNSPIQYTPQSFCRETFKAVVGFSEPRVAPEYTPAVATGNWGCGAFNGNPHLKFLIQLMAASYSQTDMAYFTFNDPDLCQDIFNMYSLLKSKYNTVDAVSSLLVEYHSKYIYPVSYNKKKKPRYSLYGFICKMCSSDDLPHQSSKHGKSKTCHRKDLTTDENLLENSDEVSLEMLFE